MKNLPYFAYGSNLLIQRIQQPNRCPTALRIALAYLPGYRLTFAKRSDVDGSGKATIEPTGHANDRVWGALFQVKGTERLALDRVEGVGNGYEVVAVEVAVRGPTAGHTSSDQKACSAFAYQAQSQWTQTDLRPMSWYRDLVAAGAFECDFPPEEIERLLAERTLEDPDRARDARERSALPPDWKATGC